MFRQPWLHFDFIYNLTKDSKEYKKHCKFVHSISKEVIQKRKHAMRVCSLVGFALATVHSALICHTIYKVIFYFMLKYIIMSHKVAKQ